MNLASSPKVRAIRESAPRDNQAPVEAPPAPLRMRGTIPVFYPDGTKAGYAEPAQVDELLRDPRHLRRGTRRKIRAVQLRGPMPEDMQLSPPGGKSSHGMPTQSESFTNPAGVYSFDSIPQHLRPNFTRVLADRTVLLRAA